MGNRKGKTGLGKIAWIILVASLLTVPAVVLSGCGNTAAEPTETETQTEPSQTETEATEVMETESTEIEIVTDYCTITYPVEWKDRWEVKQEYVGESTAVIFSCKIADEEYRLFTVCFGFTEAGDLLGYITTDAEQIPVYVDCAVLLADNPLTEEETETFYATMEGINFIVQSISANENFTTDAG